MHAPNSRSSSSSRKRKRRSRRSPADSTRPALARPAEQLGTSLEPRHLPEVILLKCVDLGFAVLVVLLPFLMGGREGPGQLVLVLTACWIAVSWGCLQFRLRGPWTFSAAEPLLLAGVALVVAQTVRLPAATLHRISPQLPQLLATWRDDGMFPAWERISFMPAETIDSLMVLIAYILIFVVALQRIRTQQDVFRLLTMMACVTTAMAVFGLVQYATSNGRFFWFYLNPYTDTDRVVKGAFTNRNHFASFLALGIGPLAWCLADAALRREASDSAPRGVGAARVALIVAAASVVIFAALLSLSRGGTIALGVACIVCGIALYRSSVISGQIMGAGVCVVALTCGLMVVYGQDQIQKRLDQIVSADAEQLDSSEGRRAIWSANLDGIRAFPLAGTGAGTHREVYPIYMEDSGADHRNEFTHAENGYLQVGLETGITGMVIVGLGFLLALWWALTGPGRRDCPLIAAARTAAVSGLLVSLTHSAADFVWYVPACMIPVILLSAAACRLRQLQKSCARSRPSPQLRLPRIAWPIAIAGVLVLAVWMVPAKYRRMEAQHHWYKYLRISLRSEEASEAAGTNLLRNRLLAVSRTIAADPDQPRPHVRMASLCLQAFEEQQAGSENRMSLGMIRDAALSNPWESQAHRDEWLNRVLGDRGAWLHKALHHTQRTLDLCPLQGRAYLYLSELGFLDASGRFDSNRLVDQALLVRPHHPQILFAAGRERLLAGDGKAALTLWKRTFSLSRRYQSAILSQMATVVSAPELIRTFEPDAEALLQLSERYRELGYIRDLQYTMQAAVAACFRLSEDPETPRERAIRFLLIARKACDELGEPNGARQCFAKAIQLWPQDFRTHYQFGVWLAEHGEFAAAAEEFRICADIRPGDSHTRRLVAAMRKKSVDAQLNPGQLATGPARSRF